MRIIEESRFGKIRERRGLLINRELGRKYLGFSEIRRNDSKLRIVYGI